MAEGRVGCWTDARGIQMPYYGAGCLHGLTNPAPSGGEAFAEDAEAVEIGHDRLEGEGQAAGGVVDGVGQVLLRGGRLEAGEQEAEQVFGHGRALAGGFEQ